VACHTGYIKAGRLFGMNDKSFMSDDELAAGWPSREEDFPCTMKDFVMGTRSVFFHQSQSLGARIT